MSWRHTSTGMSRPASAATPAAQAPAASTTTGALTSPREVRMPATRPPSIGIAVTSAPVSRRAPRSRAAARKLVAVIDGSA